MPFNKRTHIQDRVSLGRPPILHLSGEGTQVAAGRRGAGQVLLLGGLGGAEGGVSLTGCSPWSCWSGCAEPSGRDHLCSTHTQKGIRPPSVPLALLPGHMTPQSGRTLTIPEAPGVGLKEASGEC